MSTVFDLTGTTWYLNENVDITEEVDGITFYINGTTDDGLEFTSIKFEAGNIYYDSELVYNGSWAIESGGEAVDTNSPRRNISITGGSDVNNAILIEWLNTYATLISIPSYPHINQFLYYGKPVRYINGKKIRYIHYGENRYEMVYPI